MDIRNIYHEMTSFTSLMQARHEISVGKSENRDNLRFENNLEDNVHELSATLRRMCVPEVSYKSFYVYVPKTRKVIYIDFTSKIIQRAIYDQINPRLNKMFISTTYACIPGRGQLAAMNQVKEWMKKTRTNPGDWYCYKFDVSKYFYRINHSKLIEMIEHKIHDSQVNELLQYYICNSKQPFGLPLCTNQVEIDEDDMLWDVGIPIGGGLSHTLGNLYLDPLDQFAKRTLGVKRYARYMDDILIIDNNKDRIKENGKRMNDFLNEKLLLQFNQKTALRPARCGVEFVGNMIFDDHVYIRKSTTLRMKRRLANVMEMYNRGEIKLEQALQTTASYRAMLKNVDMDRFKEKLWADFVLTRGDLKAAREKALLYTEW